jgi:flagellar protein FlaF
MNMHSPVDIYRNTYRSTLPDREIEADVFNQAAIVLIECLEGWDDDAHAERIARAMDFNQRVWCIIQSELIRADNPIPNELRLNVLKLSALFDKQLLEFRYRPRKEKLRLLIDINRAIAGGLRRIN